MSFEALGWLDEQLEGLDQAKMRRYLRDREGAQADEIQWDGKPLVSFASNDYLGLASDPRLVSAAIESARAAGWGSGASPSITGHTGAQATLESKLADFEGTDAAIVFGSGFAANVGVVTSLVGRGDTVFSDAKNHASLIDGCRLSRAHVKVYRHGDANHLESLLRECSKSGGGGRRLIVTDGLFSMDGDLAPLREIVELSERYGTMLVVDEAHATGVLGPSGRGSCEHFGVEDRVPVRVGTLSKALGSVGGFVVGERKLIDWLINRARSFIFSTALPAACHAASSAALEIVESEPWRRERLHQQSSWLRSELAERGWTSLGETGPIVPIRMGQPATVLAAAERLQKSGLLVPAIRPPSVPVGESLLRISLNATHTHEQLIQLLSSI